MNLLIFVVVYLMLLSVIAWGRFENYLAFVLTKRGFLEAMEREENRYYSERAEKFYENTHPSATDRVEAEAAEKNGATKEVSFHLFLNAAARESRATEYQAYFKIAKNLMDYLYRDQEFYKKGQEDFPNLSESILNALVKASEGFDKKLKWDQAKEIANVDLADPVLNSVFTKMLKGTIEKKDVGKKEWTPYFLPKEGALPLLPFITVRSNQYQIRVFLASAQVLMAIFERPDVVQSIIETRKKLHYDVSSKKMTAEEATNQFRSQFAASASGSIPPNILNWGVSKTYPGRDYE